MTKNEMTALLGSAGVTQEIITAMEQAYEMGFEQGANASKVLTELVEEAESVVNQVEDEVAHISTDAFWSLFKQLRAMQ